MIAFYNLEIKIFMLCINMYARMCKLQTKSVKDLPFVNSYLENIDKMLTSTG